jgi:hypothetical protein
MRNRLLILAPLALLCAGIVMLLSMRYAKNNAYPDYSSLRTDPRGTGALYEALDAVGIKTLRNFDHPREIIVTGATVMFIGLSWHELRRDSSFAAALRRCAERGNRVIIALDQESGIMEGISDSLVAALHPYHAQATDFLGLRADTIQNADSQTVIAPVGFTGLVWPGRSVLVVDSAWHSLVTRGPAALVAERPLGKGSVVALHSSFNLSNQGLRYNLDHAAGANPLAAYCCRDARIVLFDEWHLGIAHADGLTDFIDRYGLSPVAAAGVLWFLLFVWAARGSAAERPRTDALIDAAAGRGGEFDSLELLLASNLGESKAFDACVDEWKKSYPGRSLPRAEGADAVERYNDLCGRLSPARIVRRHTP